MTEVVKLDGSPGAGKTHTLKERLRREKRDGLGPEGFWWLNFTNSGREDVEPELRDIFPDADDVEDRARTLHGLALSLCIREGVIEHDNVSEQIIQQGTFDADETDPFAAFCRERGIPYDPDAANTRKLLSGERDTDKTGNNLFAINDYLRQTCKDPSAWRAAPVDIRIPGYRVKALLKEWDDYKRNAHDLRLYEHGDYVVEAVEQYLNPSVDVLLIDEFQDFAPLEYKIYKQWRDSNPVERVYIAGDPNQSIYSFRGGTPFYFEETDVDDTITLKESYRCPAEIANVGHSILKSHPETDPRGFDGKEAGGNVRWRSLRDKYDLRDAVIHDTDRYDADPSVFLLTRTNYQLRKLMRDLQDVGIPFELLGKGSSLWADETRQYLAFLNNWSHGADGFAKSNIREVLKALPDGDKRRKKTGKGIGNITTRDAIEPAFADFDAATDIAERLEIAGWKRNALVNAIDAPAAMSPNEVRVGTMHTAKGLEAPCVYVFATTSNSTVKRYTRNVDDAAEEHRTYYVAATRASSELNLVETYYDGPLAPPIKKIRANGEVKA